jgi:hypothetical protein
MVTEADVHAYELRQADRQSRRQARRPAVHAFRNLFLLIVLGGIIYVAAATISEPNNDGVPAWGTLMDLEIVGGYIAFVALVLCVKCSDGHKVRTIARYRKAQLYPNHPWVQYRIQHPYMSHVLVIGGMLTLLNVLNGRKR